MTQLVTVQTDFSDLDQMAQGLIGRVHSTHVILPAGDTVDEGEWAQFEITLQDGRAGLAGVGRCVTVVDNGEEREPHQRFDVVFDSLQFDTHEQRVFDHILAIHGEGGQPLEQVADADAESLPPNVEDTGNYVDVSTEFTGSVAANTVTEAELEGEQTLVASAEELDAVAAASHEATRSNGYAVAGAHALSPALHEEAFEEPLSGERIAPARPVHGSLFVYENGIPFPAKPPRPDLDAALRVTPAPRPAGSGHH